MDRRHQDIKPDSLIVAGILLTLGWYASPWQPLDTFFTQTLARLGLEYFWSFLFTVAGMLKLVASSWRCQCPSLLTWCANWITAIVTLWTGFIFVAYGPLTPTTAACWVIGIGSVASLYRNARQKQRIRMGGYGNRAKGSA